MHFRLAVFLILAMALSPSALLPAQTVRVDTTQVLNRFDPRTALGAGVDRIPVEAIDHDFTPEILKQVFNAGWQASTCWSRRARISTMGRGISL